jgi:hypothetical protein
MTARDIALMRIHKRDLKRSRIKRSIHASPQDVNAFNQRGPAVPSCPRLFKIIAPKRHYGFSGEDISVVYRLAAPKTATGTATTATTTAIDRAERASSPS